MLVPFGKSNRKTEGMILALCTKDDISGIKPVSALLDESPVMPDAMLRLVLWMRDQFFCTCYEAIHAILPPFMGMKIETEYTIVKEPETDTDASEHLVYDYIMARGGKATHRGICSAPELQDAAAVLKNMVEKGLLILSDKTENAMHSKTIKCAQLAVDEEQLAHFLSSLSKAAEKQKTVAEYLLKNGVKTVQEIIYDTGAGRSVITSLERKEIIRLLDKKVPRIPEELKDEHRETTETELSPAQDRVYREILPLLQKNEAACALLQGVTGSGKTHVYIKLIEDTLGMGKKAIVLVPEISLTPQLIRRFQASFGDRVAVIHSSLAVGERYDQWQQIEDGKADVVVGTRSAIFAPVSDIGLIVIDEEQEHTYKSGESPRYAAKDVARFRCAADKALLLLGSATPSVESAYYARTGRYSYHVLEERYAGASMPQIVTVDMKQELKSGNPGPLSARLCDEIAENLKRNEQAILFINRRGRNKRVFCMECGAVINCPNCSVSAAYHSANGRMMCHYCGWSGEKPLLCPSCGSRHLESDKAGTQMVEEQLKSVFPGIKTIRMDADTTGASHSHAQLLERFRKENIPVLIGTQMVSKGLDFENVTLAGVLDADMSLYTEDFRAAERTFSIIMQVAGRSGRGVKNGRAIIQTLTPGNEVITAAAKQDYGQFYEREIEVRRSLRLPPFTDLLVLSAASISEIAALETLRGIRNRINELLSTYFNDISIEVMGPAPASVAKVNNKYRWRLTIRMKNGRRERELISVVMREAMRKKENAGVYIWADINPYD